LKSTSKKSLHYYNLGFPPFFLLQSPKKHYKKPYKALGNITFDSAQKKLLVHRCTSKKQKRFALASEA
jgi:hypothetical protein